MSWDIKKLFQENFGTEFRASVYNNMKIAMQALQEFKKKNENFFTLDKKETLFGHFRTYVIEKQFCESSFNPSSNYEVSLREVNKYKYKALCLETADFILNVGRTNSANELLPVSSYKKEFAKANDGLETQLSFDFTKDTPKIVDKKKYAEITYGYKNEKITHLNIVLPDSRYKNIEDSINILENVKEYETYVNKETEEETIVKLKKSLEKKIEKIG